MYFLRAADLLEAEFSMRAMMSFPRSKMMLRLPSMLLAITDEVMVYQTAIFKRDRIKLTIEKERNSL